MAEARAAGLAQGVEITSVKAGSPAASAGLVGATGRRQTSLGAVPTGGDVITALDGTRVTGAQQIISTISQMTPGDRVTLTSVRGGSTRQVAVTLGSTP